MATVIKNIPYIGGSSQTFEFDFGTKVAGSTVECPMNLYWAYTTTIETPNNITNDDGQTGFSLVGPQSWAQNTYDMMKILDGSCNPSLKVGAGIYAQCLVELDLNPLCNSLYGGSLDALCSTCTNIEVTVYAKGSGSNSGTQANGVIVKRWYADGPYWDHVGEGENDTGDIDGIYSADNRFDGTKWGFLRNNKFYIIIYAKYPSDGTIPSEVDIDYINIKLTFNKIPDVIAPIPITLPDTWSLLVKGVSPSWDDSVSNNKVVFSLLNGQDTSVGNFVSFYYDTVVQKYKIVNYDGSSALFTCLTGEKYQSINFLIEQTSTGTRIRSLCNGRSVEKFSNTIKYINANNSLGLYVGQQFNGYQVDAFINSIAFIPNKNFDDDTEAEGILRGTTQGFENDELLTVDLQTGIYTSGGQYSGYSNIVMVLPNNQYEFIYNSNVDNTAIEFFELNNKNQITIKRWYGGNGTATITTSPTTTQIQIKYYDPGSHAGQTMQWTNCSLKLKM